MRNKEKDKRTPKCNCGNESYEEITEICSKCGDEVDDCDCCSQCQQIESECKCDYYDY